MSKKVLLIADDIDMNRNVIKRFLKNDYEILEAADGLQVLNLLQNTHVDAILLDIIMPGLDGLQVLERVRGDERFAGMGILVATSAKEKTERTALSLGADDIVSKPYDPIVIQKRLQNILTMKDAERKSHLTLDANADELVSARLSETGAKVAEHATTLHSMAAIIKGSLDNRQLLLDIADRLDREAAGLTALFDAQ